MSRIVFVGIALALASSARGQTGRDTANYTADRPVDFVHMRLELTFTADGIRARTCEGRVEYTLRPRAAGMDTVRLDAVDLRILGVEVPGSHKAAEFGHDDRILTVKLPKAVGKDETFKLAVRYRVVEPNNRGMHFVLPNASRPNRPPTVYTQGEPLQARNWFPTHDWPNQRWTSDIVVTVPPPYTAVSNGVLESRKSSSDGKSITFHWRNAVPTAPHHVGVVVGELVELQSEWRGKPIRVYTQPGNEAAARYTFRRVPEMLDLYTKLTGVEFPYPGYTHITIPGHHHGGMEHAGFSFMDTYHIAASDDGEVPLEFTESNYISHMLAHQWFGGIVNYRAVSHAWLNEGFAILLDSLWTTQTDAPDRFPCKMWETARMVARFDPTETGKPMVLRHYDDPDDVFHMDAGKVYYKGAWVLQMLRHQLGEEVFWKAVTKYLNDYRGQGVETADLRKVMEDVSSRDLEQFFQQWAYGRGVPRLAVSYAWDVTKKRATVTVKQTQKIDSTIPAFAFPLDLHFRVGGADEYRTVQVTDTSHEFAFDFASEPDVFCVDPKGGLLKTLTVTAPRAMLVRQVRNGPTALSRFMAVEEQGRTAGPEGIAALRQAIADEAEFWMVRHAAAIQLGRMQTESALQALLEVERRGVGNPRVLGGVVEGLGAYVVSSDAQTAVLKYGEGHKSLDVQRAAVAVLPRMRAGPDLAARSVRALEAAIQKPTRRAVRSTALFAVQTLDDPRHFEPVLKLAQPGGNDEMRDLAVRALGRLGRREDVRDRTRETLTSWLYDPDASAREAAASGLGALGDPRSIADLERIKSSAREEDLRKAAGNAIEAIRRPADPRQSTAALLQRLEAIEKQNRELETKLKNLAPKDKK